MTIKHPEKIGIGTWDSASMPGTPVDDVDRVGFAWYYNWSIGPLEDLDSTPERSAFVPMTWGHDDATSQNLTFAKATEAAALLGFNEPDHQDQANMTVEQALELWPQLENTGMRLGSPAPSQDGVLGDNSWLGRFMAGAGSKGLDVDFIAVHYYSADKNVDEFKHWLEAVSAQYDKPVWVTEWALADWANPSRFSAVEQAEFARAGTEMMDDLSFVERHAWFAAYEGGDGWNLHSGVLDASGALTPVGEVFSQLNGPAPSLAPGDLRVTVSGDHYLGAAEFEVEVDGVSVGVSTVTADHKLGQWQDIVIDGSWADGVDHTVKLKFLNDAWGGTPDTDRNLWVKNVEMNGVMAGQETQLMRSGTGQMDSQVSWVIDDTPALDVITVKASGDYYRGDPNFSISVDGKVIDATNVVTADQANNEWQTFTFTGDFNGNGAGSHAIGITFTEDAWDGTPSTDRNLYVDAVTLNGETSTAGATYYSAGENTWSFSR